MSQHQMSKVVVRVVGAAVVTALAVGCGAIQKKADEQVEKGIQNDLPKIGGCYSATDSVTDSKLTKQDCSEAEAMYRAIAILGDDDAKTCDDLGAHGSYQSYVVGGGSNVSSTVCGVLNLEVGDCVAGGLQLDTADCSDASASPEKVTKFVDVKSEKAANDPAIAQKLCGPKAVNFIGYVSDKQIACLGAVA